MNSTFQTFEQPTPKGEQVQKHCIKNSPFGGWGLFLFLSDNHNAITER